MPGLLFPKPGILEQKINFLLFAAIYLYFSLTYELSFFQSKEDER